MNLVLYYPMTLIVLIVSIFYWGHMPSWLKFFVILNALLAAGRAVLQIVKMRNGR
ncbi:MAG TPA: hypothetical protein VFV52_11700 [Bacilli bacterium]|nr:hypothetical protein [Bacilli bacterium]